MLYKNLKENLFAVIEYPQAVQQAVAETMRYWEEFCKLPQEVKDLFIYPNHEEKFDVGYRRREREKGRDDKEYFHFCMYNSLFLLDYSEAKIEYEKMASIRNFFQSAEKLHNLVSNKMIRDIVPTLENESEGKLAGLTQEVFPRIGLQVIRFLHYTPSVEAKTDIIGDAHYDRSGFTLHLHESGPGLELLPLSEKGKKAEDMQWIPAPMSPDSTLIFTGYQVSQMSGNDLKAAWHRVRSLHSVHKERFSAVMFNALISVPSYDPDERSQELVPGHGY